MNKGMYKVGDKVCAWVRCFPPSLREKLELGPTHENAEVAEVVQEEVAGRNITAYRLRSLNTGKVYDRLFHDNGLCKEG